jgi:hypothetical protein
VDRRTFLMGSVGLLAAALAAEAQQPGKVYRIGMLERTSPETNAANLEGFRQGLRALGYVEGKRVPEGIRTRVSRLKTRNSSVISRALPPLVCPTCAR